MCRKRRQQDFDAEIEAHLQLEADQFRSEGLTEAEARLAALQAFGNRTSAQERFYESARRMFFHHLARDVRLAVRVLKKDGTFSAVAVAGPRARAGCEHGDLCNHQRRNSTRR